MDSLIKMRLLSLVSINVKKEYKINIPVFDIIESDGQVYLTQVGKVVENVTLDEISKRIEFYNFMLMMKLKLYLDEVITIELDEFEYVIELKGSELVDIISNSRFTLDYWMLKKLQFQFKFDDGNVTFYSIQ